MLGTEWGSVTALDGGWPGAQLLRVALERGDEVPALGYPQLVGSAEPGDRVAVSTAALDAGLGTGGQALVILVDGRCGDPPAGRLMKARYTPQQVALPEPPEPGITDLSGCPVVALDLHSQLPAVLAGARATRADPRVVLVLDDAAALPLAYSRTVAALRGCGWLAGVVTAGQAYGGDLEAVSIFDALLLARGRLEAELVIVAPGPGGVGTGTEWGFSGVAAGQALNAAGVLGGRPVGALRLSQADPRPRHNPLSHHSVTAYRLVTLVAAELPYPAGWAEVERALLAADITAGGRHRTVSVEVGGLAAALRACPVPLATMGRGLAEDELAFLAAAVAGRHAAGMLNP